MLFFKEVITIHKNNKDKRSALPKIPLALHTQELFKKSDAALKKLRKLFGRY